MELGGEGGTQVRVRRTASEGRSGQPPGKEMLKKQKKPGGGRANKKESQPDALARLVSDFVSVSLKPG